MEDRHIEKLKETAKVLEKMPDMIYIEEIAKKIYNMENHTEYKEINDLLVNSNIDGHIYLCLADYLLFRSYELKRNAKREEKCTTQTQRRTIQ